MHVRGELEYMVIEISRALCNLQTLHEYILDLQEGNIDLIKQFRTEISFSVLSLLNSLKCHISEMEKKVLPLRTLV